MKENKDTDVFNSKKNYETMFKQCVEKADTDEYKYQAFDELRKKRNRIVLLLDSYDKDCKSTINASNYEEQIKQLRYFSDKLDQYLKDNFSEEEKNDFGIAERRYNKQKDFKKAYDEYNNNLTLKDKLLKRKVDWTNLYMKFHNGEISIDMVREYLGLPMSDVLGNESILGKIV